MQATRFTQLVWRDGDGWRFLDKEHLLCSPRKGRVRLLDAQELGRGAGEGWFWCGHVACYTPCLHLHIRFRWLSPSWATSGVMSNFAILSISNWNCNYNKNKIWKGYNISACHGRSNSDPVRLANQMDVESTCLPSPKLADPCFPWAKSMMTRRSLQSFGWSMRRTRSTPSGLLGTWCQSSPWKDSPWSDGRPARNWHHILRAQRNCGICTTACVGITWKHFCSLSSWGSRFTISKSPATTRLCSCLPGRRRTLFKWSNPTSQLHITSSCFSDTDRANWRNLMLNMKQDTDHVLKPSALHVLNCSKDQPHCGDLRLNCRLWTL